MNWKSIKIELLFKKKVIKYAVEGKIIFFI